MKKFSDFAKDDSPPDGEKIRIDKVLDKPILIYRWHIRPSKQKQGEDYMTIQFAFKDDETDKRYIIFTGSTVLMDQAKRHNEPEFETTIKKMNNYYTFS